MPPRALPLSVSRQALVRTEHPVLAAPNIPVTLPWHCPALPAQDCLNHLQRDQGPPRTLESLLSPDLPVGQVRRALPGTLSVQISTWPLSCFSGLSSEATDSEWPSRSPN